MLTATANAVNLTDGLDGLVAGSGALVFGAYVLIAFWQFRNFDFYGVDGALDLAVFAAALVGAVLGFLWWNAAPAEIFMGDTGSQALGGALAALALLTNTQLLLILLGGLYVDRDLSVILQVFSFRVFGKRIFRMAPHPSPLRAEGVAGDHGDHPVLDHRRHHRRRRRRPLLRRLPRRHRRGSLP